MKGLFSLLLLYIFLPLLADNDTRTEKSEEESAGERLKMVKEVPTTPVRDQYKSSTCWSFCGISLLETELIRMGREEVDLSEMFIVRHNYERKAERFIRMHGKTNFAPGGEANDVTDVIAEFGIIPESAYSGLKVDSENHIHSEMDELLEEYVESIVSNPNKQLSPVWKEGFEKVLDSYLGEIPEEFDYNGKTYTAKEFAEYLGIQPENYVMITSFSHQPYYESFVLEVPDNWSWAYSYNVKLDELEQIVDSALINGYSLAWAADVSEDGFSFEEGVALAPKLTYAPRSVRQEEKWENMTKEEKDKIIFSSRKPVEELQVDQTIRQQAFDNYTTTDDHGMHIVGVARDNNDKFYYYVKNSWGPGNPYEGYLYVSKPYFRYKTISVMVHKDAIPEAIAGKLGL